MNIQFGGGSSGGGGGGAWGTITGTLSDQTDLSTALGNKQPLDADLTAIAGLTLAQNKFYARIGSGSGVADAVILIGSDFSLSGNTLSLSNSYQPIDPDLTSWAAITRASGFDTFATTPSSANLAALVTNETGSGLLVFATSPALVTPDLGVPTAIDLTNATKALRQVTFVVDGQGSALTTGVKTPVKIPAGGTLVGYTMVASPSGSITANIFRAADGAGLPTASIINNAGGGSGTGTLPAIASGVEGKSTTFTNWGSTTLTAFDNLALNLTTVDATVTKFTMVLYYR